MALVLVQPPVGDLDGGTASRTFWEAL